jgi:hypothetical protein
MAQISEVTRRNIFDEMTLLNIDWTGRFDEVHFLGRLFDLKSLPSTDHRFKDAGQDIWQHRVNNFDWQDDWVFYDHRFNLLYCEDSIFLRFLCETIHPVVRADLKEVEILLNIYNKHLNVDGFEIIEFVKISEKPVFKGKELSKAAKLIKTIENANLRSKEKNGMIKNGTQAGIKKQQLKVFLCHAKEDKPDVREQYSRLKKDEFVPWLDEENLLPGQDWDLEVRRSVRATDVVLVFLSKNSVTKTGYVQKEIRLAIDVAEEQPEGTIFIIPVRLEDCDVPDRLKKFHWVDLFSENGYPRLVLALKRRESELYPPPQDIEEGPETKSQFRRLSKGSDTTLQFLTKLSKYKKSDKLWDFLESLRSDFYFTLWDPADPWEDIDDYLSMLKEKGLIEIEGKNISITKKGLEYIEGHDL